MIVTLTVNPAIDRIFTVDRLAFEDRAYIRSSRESAGGRGINAACVIHSFGGNALAICTSGGATGKRMEEHLRCCGFGVDCVPIRADTRTNLTISDKRGLTINLNEAGPAIDGGELARLEERVRARLTRAVWLAVCGSIPPGVPAQFYGRVIAAAREKKVKTLIDSDGPPLREGIAARPTVAMPNQQEAERLLNRALVTTTHFLQAVGELRQMGAESVILSLGSRGALAAFDDGIYEVSAPQVDTVCPIGSGDALAAAYIWAEARGVPPPEAVRWGVAAGTASARLPGMRFASLEETQETFKQVEVRRVE